MRGKKTEHLKIKKDSVNIGCDALVDAISPKWLETFHIEKWVHEALEAENYEAIEWDSDSDD